MSEYRRNSRRKRTAPSNQPINHATEATTDDRIEPNQRQYFPSTYE
ncbi:hypothetical protein [Natronolimnobius baerhuensis]|nr:hypothetical protein [Natronolimnobius baerhuensis]